ncbi:MAG: hypothetical protein ACYS17_00580 [Planctomycetota bacterium]
MAFVNNLYIKIERIIEIFEEICSLKSRAVQIWLLNIVFKANNSFVRERNKRMTETSLLLKAYYEALYERLQTNKEFLTKRVEEVLAEEVLERGYNDFDDDKHSAYTEACLAFIDERIETYNPFGIQYTFDQTRAREAFELELQLDWYDSRAEFENLVRTARKKGKSDEAEQRLNLLAEELIKELGAFPDKTIISAYKAEPTLRKLPDYIVARTIEEILK